MQTRVLPLENGKDPAPPRPPPRSFLFKVLVVLVILVALGAGFSMLGIYMTGFYGVQQVISQTTSSFRPCIDEKNNLDQWIRPPEVLMHSMTDEELFWRASLVPEVRRYPFRRVPKIAFMFLAIGPLPLAPLWEKFLQGHERLYSIYIHQLPDYQPDFLPNSSFYRRQVPSKVVEWGKMSMCDAERRLLANALLDISNEWFVLLSESCIPLHNFSTVYTYLMRSRYSYIGAFDDTGPYGRGRYNPEMLPEINITQWRKGSQWFEINRQLAVSIVKDTIFYPKFEKFCKPHCYVDEHYFPTMLSIEAPHLLANRSITLADWSRGGAHPATFGKGDITKEFLKKLQNVGTCMYNDQAATICFLFARKFAPSSLEPLLQFAPVLLGFG